MFTPKIVRHSTALAVAAIAAIGSVLASSPAAYAVTYTLSACNGGLGCGTGNNFGTVSVTADGANTVKIDVDLAANVVWAGSGLIGFAFYLPGVTGVTLTNVPAGSVLPSAFWTPNTNGAGLLTSFETDGFKVGGTQKANWGLDRTDSGTSSNDSSNLTFDITATGLSLASFASWSGNDQPGTAVFFIADIGIGCTAGVCSGTGLVGATLSGGPAPPPAVPIPGALPLFAGGGAVLGLLGWRRKRRMARQAA
jgi:hypothetical protein